MLRIKINLDQHIPLSDGILASWKNKGVIGWADMKCFLGYRFNGHPFFKSEEGLWRESTQGQELIHVQEREFFIESFFSRNSRVNSHSRILLHLLCAQRQVLASPAAFCLEKELSVRCAKEQLSLLNRERMFPH